MAQPSQKRTDRTNDNFIRRVVRTAHTAIKRLPIEFNSKGIGFKGGYPAYRDLIDAARNWAVALTGLAYDHPIALVLVAVDREGFVLRYRYREGQQDA